MKKIKIIVVTHKEVILPTSNIYFPVCVGTGIEKLKSIYRTDNTGINISEKNLKYCELTALYWAWKNLECDVLGITHYRRFFSLKNSKHIEDILNDSEVEKLLNKNDIIVAKKRRYIQTVKKHYINCIKSRRNEHKIQLELLRDTIQVLSPEYVKSFDKVMKGHSAHMLNMFIGRKALVNEYCEWLFPILFELENKINSNNVMYDRIMGAFGEFLLDTWIYTRGLKFEEVKILETEYDLIKKIKWALNRKLVE